MIISLIGASSTGKTTLSSALKQNLGSEWSVFDDYYRQTALKLGYQSPREAILESSDSRQFASTAMTASALGAMLQWCENLDGGHGIIDTGLPSILSFHQYWLNVCDSPISPYTLRLAQAIAKKIDAYIYLPIDVLPIENDGLRSTDSGFQKEIDQWIAHCQSELQIPESSVLRIEGGDLGERVEKCMNLISTLLRKEQADYMPNSQS
ncbi:ATP/GTP-binding protein [Endozoicomonas ascidiicola]|uniref:ATP/GTP-binding protein n=1 Tax=Endozoicomonas ascidiicola TaxID=1698521 RepID=UPI00082D99B2|nr:ATP-binding protein [Endozoicomonas ascidiicola]